MIWRAMPSARASCACCCSSCRDTLQHDGGVQSLDLGLAAPSRDAEHIARLIALRLDRLGDGLDADFGFEAAAVHVLVAEPLAERQERLGMDEDERLARWPAPS